LGACDLLSFVSILSLPFPLFLLKKNHSIHSGQGKERPGHVAAGRGQRRKSGGPSCAVDATPDQQAAAAKEEEGAKKLHVLNQRVQGKHRHEILIFLFEFFEEAVLDQTTPIEERDII
jgi:hypothetical protein